MTDDTQDVPQPREDSRTAATLPAHGPQVPSSADEELPDDEVRFCGDLFPVCQCALLSLPTCAHLVS